MSHQPSPLPELAQRILEHESKVIDTRVVELLTTLANARHLLGACCELFNLRQRYFAQVGEHFSVQDEMGIALVDALDERLLRGYQRVFVEYEKSGAYRPPTSQALQMLERYLAEKVTPLPQFPVSYMVLHALRQMLAAFEPSPRLTAEETEELEAALAERLIVLVKDYFTNRDTQVKRHLTDVAREYSVVQRLKCSCGKEKYQVKLQSLNLDKGGNLFDELQLSCAACGAERALRFALPNFKDLSGA